MPLLTQPSQNQLLRIVPLETLTDMGSTTYNHRKGSVFSSAMKRSAERRKCPNRGRKSALIRDAELRETVCRWDCGYWLDWDADYLTEEETK